MRRAHSVRNHANGRPSLQLGMDDMGALTEGDERPEDGLRKKLLEKDRENDKVCFGFLLSYLVVTEPYVAAVVAYADPDVTGSALPTTICGSCPGATTRVQEPGTPLARDSAREREVYGGTRAVRDVRSRKDYRAMPRSLIRYFFRTRSKMQVKHLEQALTDLAGPNWKVIRLILLCPRRTPG